MGAQLKTLLAGDRVLRVFALGHLCSPKLVEIIGWRGGFDAVWFDQEHAGLTMAQTEEAARAARVASSTWRRLRPQCSWSNQTASKPPTQPSSSTSLGSHN